jgi:hypothetical protein
MNKTKTKYVIAVAAVPIVLLLIGTTTASAFAWGDGGWGGYHHWGHWNQGYDYAQDQDQQSNGYNVGIADAIYDHDNNLAYNPVGQCLQCHSQEYWDNFKQGYDSQWSSYTSTEQTQSSTQGASITIYGNNYGDVSVGQSNNQGQTALAGLPHLIGQGLCHLVGSSCDNGGGQQVEYVGGQSP